MTHIIGSLYDVKGELMILKEDDKELLFHARSYNKYIDKHEFDSMIRSGEATLIRETDK